MLIHEKLQTGDFSSAEKNIITYILEHKTELQNMTTRQIAEHTYTSPSLLVRIAHKLNFHGWNDLKTALIKEDDYLNNSFCDIDANFPFQKNDTFLSIANKISALEQESINDTRKLLKSRSLNQAIQIIRTSSRITLFAVSNNALISHEFRHRMSRIQHLVDIPDLQGELQFAARLAPADSCAMIVSYSGETPILTQVAKILRERKIPIILITNIGESTLSKMADCILHICTREKLYSKIGTFSTDCSINYLLDVIYSCIYAIQYDKNKELRIASSRQIETGRKSSTSVLTESSPHDSL